MRISTIPDGIADTFGGEIWFYIWAALLVATVVTFLLNLGPTRAAAKRKEVEDALPDFLNGLAENVRAGMSVEAAIDGLAKQRDDRMGYLLKRMVATMHSDSFAAAMEQFAREADSKMVSRVISILNVALVSAGSFSDVLERLGEEFWDVYLLKQERDAKTSSQANFILFGGAALCPAILGLIIATIGGGDLVDQYFDEKQAASYHEYTDLLVASLKLFTLALGAASVLMNGVIKQTLKVAFLKIPLFQLLAYTIVVVMLQVSL